MGIKDEAYLAKILIVDDDKEFCEVLENTLTIEGFRTDSVFNGEEALIRISERPYQLVILDLTLPDISGMQVLKRIKEINSQIQVIIVSAVDTVGSAVESLKTGAFDFITKPIMLDDVVISIKKALRRKKKDAEEAEKSGSMSKAFIGECKVIKEMVRLVEKVAPTDSTVLINGESGTGKELIAQSIYMNSNRKDKPFVKISCAALPETLLESELFGYLKGAFTGATSTKKGLFEVAQGGTLFLDEVSEVSLGIQAKLLRALQEREIKPLGGTKDIPIDVRFIAATNKNLSEEIAKGNFREDLYYRLNVINLVLPPLRERKEDIPMLVHHFIERYTPKKNGIPKKVTPEVIECFYRYRWSGNIREMENVIERAIILGTGDTITLADIPERIRNFDAKTIDSVTHALDADAIPPLDAAVEALERDLIHRAMVQSHNVVSNAAKLLSIKRTTLIAKMKKLGI
jgi:two-component system NtrC family response regulator